MDELRESVGHRLYADMMAVGWSSYTFDSNFLELKELLVWLTEADESVELAALKNRDRLIAMQREVARRVHNFVASAASLRFHTTAFRDHWYTDPERGARVEVKLAETFDDPESQFVQKLRVYVQKYTMPPLSFVMRGTDDGGFTRDIALSVEELRRWDGWKAKATAFLDAADRNVPLLVVIRRYRERVRAFQIWLENDLRDLYGEELAERDAKERELALMELESALDRPRVTLPNGVVTSKDNAFINVFGSSEFAELEQLPDGSPERGQRAIELLESMGLVTPSIREKVERLYAAT
jgi:hypothetical protein